MSEPELFYIDEMAESKPEHAEIIRAWKPRLNWNPVPVDYEEIGVDVAIPGADKTEFVGYGGRRGGGMTYLNITEKTREALLKGVWSSDKVYGGGAGGGKSEAIRAVEARNKAMRKALGLPEQPEETKHNPKAVQEAIRTEGIRLVDNLEAHRRQMDYNKADGHTFAEILSAYANVIFDCPPTAWSRVPEPITPEVKQTD